MRTLLIFESIVCVFLPDALLRRELLPVQRIGEGTELENSFRLLKNNINLIAQSNGRNYFNSTVAGGHRYRAYDLTEY